jgi:anaphase-promoting complex subunit 11
MIKISCEAHTPKIQPMKVTIKSPNPSTHSLEAFLIGKWTWKGEEEVCGICKSELDGTSPESEYPGDDCPVVWGKCTHPFHLTCIMKWLTSQEQQNLDQNCPVCRRKWEFSEEKKVDAQNISSTSSISAHDLTPDLSL